MTTIVAGFVIQDANSPEEKFYAAFAYPLGNGEYRFTRAWGPYAAFLVSNQTKSRCHTRDGLSEVQARNEMLGILRAKRGRGYTEDLAGPIAFEMDADQNTDPNALLTAIRTAPASFSGNSTTLEQAIATMVAKAQQPSTNSGPSANATGPARTFLSLEADEANGITLPNGRVMYSREVDGHSDVVLLRHLREQARNGKPALYVRLFGPAGGGKTTVAMGAFGKDLITVNGHGDLTVSHLVGQYVPKENGHFDYVDGPLARAMREGRPFLLDEATRIPPETMSVLLSVADDRGTLNTDDRPGAEPIVAQPGFYMVLSYNESGAGVRQLDEAVMRRFPIAIEVSTDVSAAEAAGVDRRAIEMVSAMKAKSDEDRQNRGAGYWVPQLSHLLVFQQVLDADLGLSVALSTLISACPDHVSLEVMQEHIKAVFGEQGMSLTLGTRAMAAAA